MCHWSSFTLPLLSAAKFSEFGAQCLYTSNIPPCVIIHIRHSSTHTINKTYFNRKPSLALVGIVLLNIGCGVGIFKSLMHWCALMSESMPTITTSGNECLTVIAMYLYTIFMLLLSLWMYHCWHPISPNEQQADD